VEQIHAVMTGNYICQNTGTCINFEAKHVMLVEGNCVLASQNCDMLIRIWGTNTQIVHVLRIWYCSSYKYQSVFHASYSTDIRR